MTYTNLKFKLIQINDFFVNLKIFYIFDWKVLKFKLIQINDFFVNLKIFYIFDWKVSLLFFLFKHYYCYFFYSSLIFINALIYFKYKI